MFLIVRIEGDSWEWDVVNCPCCLEKEDQITPQGVIIEVVYWVYVKCNNGIAE
jgi:hypothetical protein